MSASVGSAYSTLLAANSGRTNVLGATAPHSATQSCPRSPCRPPCASQELLRSATNGKTLKREGGHHTSYLCQRPEGKTYPFNQTASSWPWPCAREEAHLLNSALQLTEVWGNSCQCHTPKIKQVYWMLLL